MIVLGISPLDKDASVSLVENGKVIFAAGEERFTRKKIQDGFPLNALETALSYTGTKIQGIDVVAYPFFEWEKEASLFSANFKAEKKYLNETPVSSVKKQLETALQKVPNRSGSIAGLSHPNEKMDKRFDYKLFYKLAGSEGVISRNLARRGSNNWEQGAKSYHKIWHEELEDNLNKLGLLHKLKRYDHHMSHSANAYYASGYDRALIVTLDGYGSGLAGSVSIGAGNQIRRIHELQFPHSLGTFYESVTSSLGFKPGRHEGKIVGLAAYGDPNILLDLILSRFHQEPGNFRILEINNIFFSRNLATLFPKIDVAAVYQKVLEIVA
ncbi:MAG: carbamoyltransferase N-terminal domain-containing protein, partial [bacterium]